MDSIHKIKKALDEFRTHNTSFITVNNSEWITLFRDEIRNSIAIEGIFANRNELRTVLELGSRTSNQKSAAILGYFEAASTLYEYAANQYETGEFNLRLSDLKQIHTLLMRYEHQLGTFVGKLGGFRDEEVKVTESTFTPLSYHHLPLVLPVVVQWHNKNFKTPNFDPLTFFAGSHIIFETIHPFRDGNGRVGRILLSYLLIGSGYINLAIKGTQKQDREKYYHALETGDDEIEKYLRKIENGTEPTVAGLDSAVNKSNLDELKSIINTNLKTSFSRIERGVITTDKDAFLPLREAARFYNYSQDYLRQLIHMGKLSGEKRGKLWFVKVGDIEAYAHSVNNK